MWYIHCGVLFSQKNEIMLLAGKWMELEIIILTEISQAQKANYHIFSLVSVI
jgi:hypothetical protein